jgi:hypothetical protein
MILPQQLHFRGRIEEVNLTLALLLAAAVVTVTVTPPTFAVMRGSAVSLLNSTGTAWHG